jgi:MFS family permease
MRRLTDLGLDVALVPVAWVSLQLLKGLFNVPGGRASDRYGRRRVLALAADLTGEVGSIRSIRQVTLT